MAIPSNPRPETPQTDPALRPNPAPERSLVEQLGETADELRQIAVELGARPYRVFSVTLRWSGGQVGRGVAQCAAEVELLPTPELVTFEGVRSELRAGGRVERGDARLQRISPRYTEDEVRTLFGCAREGIVPVDCETFLEVRVDARDGTSERRRFAVVGVPYRRPTGFEWIAKLLRQDSNRTRDGAVVDVPG